MSLRHTSLVQILSGLFALMLLTPGPSQAGDGSQFHSRGPHPLPQSPLTALPPTYNPPGQLPPTFIPPGQLPPWAFQPPPPSTMPSIPSDPSLSHRNLLNEEMRLRGWNQDQAETGRWKNWPDDRWSNASPNGWQQ